MHLCFLQHPFLYNRLPHEKPAEKTIDLFEQKAIKDNLFERKEKGTLKLFEEWLSLNFMANDPQELKKLFIPFKKIRQERQTPAHKIDENLYDKKYIEKQKKLIEKSYSTMRTIRNIFQKHPNGKNVEIKKWLDEGEIKVF